MGVRERVVLEHMHEDALDIVNFAKEVGNIGAFSSNKLYRKAITV